MPVPKVSSRPPEVIVGIDTLNQISKHLLNNCFLYPLFAIIIYFFRTNLRKTFINFVPVLDVTITKVSQF